MDEQKTVDGQLDESMTLASVWKEGRSTWIGSAAIFRRSAANLREQAAKFEQWAEEHEARAKENARIRQKVGALFKSPA